MNAGITTLVVGFIIWAAFTAGVLALLYAYGEQQADAEHIQVQREGSP